MIALAVAIAADPASWHHALGLVLATSLGLVLCLAYLVGDMRRARR